MIAALAGSAQCNRGTLYMIAKGHKKPGPKLAHRLEFATGGKVSRQNLRPDIFGPTPADVWPPANDTPEAHDEAA